MKPRKEYSDLWTTFAASALAAVWQEPPLIQSGDTPVSKVAALLADEMLDEWIGRFEPEATK